MADQQSLHHYYLFWAGQQVSSLGSALVSFVIIWWITLTTDSAWYLALSSAVSFGGMLISQLFAGYLTDYFNRKRIILTVDFLQALATTVLVVLFYFQTVTITVVLVLLGIRGVFDGFHRPATGAILPSMVPVDQLQRVNSLNSMFQSGINVIAPPLAAILLLLTDQMWLLLSLDAITFAIALLPLLFISIPSITPSMGDSLRSRLVQGWIYIRSTPGLFPLLVIFASFNFFVTPISVLTPLLVLSNTGFGESRAILALVLAASNLAMIIMSSILSRIRLPLTEIVGVMIGFGFTMLGLSLLSWSIYSLQLWLFVVGQVIIGLSLPVVNVFSAMIWQKRVPAELQGRVISVRMMIVLWVLPISMILTGIVGDLVAWHLFFAGATLGFGILLGLIWMLTDLSISISVPANTVAMVAD